MFHEGLDYFDLKRDSLFPDAHQKIAIFCIHYLSCDALNDLSPSEYCQRDASTNNSFLIYSANNLRHHIHQQKVEKMSKSETFEKPRQRESAFIFIGGDSP
jgi:hypothetical protein